MYLYIYIFLVGGIFSRGDFSWENSDTLSQISNKAVQDTRKATLHCKG